MKTLLLIFLLSILFTSCAQKSYTGTINNWSHNKADIILPSEEPIVIGTVSDQGEVVLSLQEDLVQTLRRLQAQENKNSNITIKNSTVRDAFYCDDTMVAVKNGEIVLEKATSRGTFYVGDLENKELYGQLRLSSSTAFNESYFSLGKKDFVQGYYIDYFYVPAPASVKGECRTETFTLDLKDTFYSTVIYDIELEAGWNLVKIELVDTYTDQEGNARPLVTKMESIKELPEETQFLLSN